MTPEAYDARLSRATEAVVSAGLRGLLATPGPNLAYLTGYAPLPLERLTLLIVSPGRDPVLLVPALESPAARASPVGERIEVVAWTDGEDPYEAAARLLRGQPSDVTATAYAVSDQAWASHVLGLQRVIPAGTTLVPQGEAIPLLRAVKDEAELALLRAAARGADAAFAAMVDLPFEGRRELDVAAELERLLRGHGHERVDFTIVGSGPNGASPHHGAGERVTEPGDAVVLDFGGVAGGYFSDITRTVFVGEPTGEHRRVYETVHAAQQAAFEAVRPGVACQDVDRAARAVIAGAGYGELFIHRTGHGIGLEAHEPPYIVEGNGIPLEAGMTFSDEPGIYLPGRFGVRIEDQVAVTADGAERLNQASRELTVVA